MASTLAVLSASQLALVEVCYTNQTCGAMPRGASLVGSVLACLFVGSQRQWIFVVYFGVQTYCDLAFMHTVPHRRKLLLLHDIDLICVYLAQAGVKLISLPSKRLGLFTTAASTIIARSDSNGEDLEAFAGAGKQLLAFLLLCAICSHTKHLLMS